MRLTQGTFSFLPDLTDAQVRTQVEYCVDNGWAVNVEYTDDPHPRNTYWELWGQPMFDLGSASPVMDALAACREANPGCYVRISAFDATKGWESIRLSFIVQRPEDEPGFRLTRTEGRGRNQHYAVGSYGTDQPEGRRYR